jgi:hypothetical protein
MSASPLDEDPVTAAAPRGSDPVTAATPRKAVRPGVALFVWAFLIFFTSCFVVFTPEFFRFMTHVIPGQMAQGDFVRFWYIGGIFVIKGWHATEYAILDSLLFLWLRTRMPTRRALAAALLLSVLFAASDEWHQTFVPGRDGNARDACIDTAGAIVATAVWAVKTRRAAGASSA